MTWSDITLAYQVPLPVVLAACATMRLALFRLGGLASALERRPELATPLTSMRSCTYHHAIHMLTLPVREGVYIWKHGGNPYDGGVFYHVSPLLLGQIDRTVTTVPWSVLAHVTHFSLFDGGSVDRCRYWNGVWPRRDCKKQSGCECSRLPCCGYVSIASFELLIIRYLLNPYTVLSCLARSTTSIDNSLLVLAIASLSSGKLSVCRSDHQARSSSVSPSLLLPRIPRFTPPCSFQPSSWS